MNLKAFNRIKENYYVEPTEYIIRNFSIQDVNCSLSSYIDEFFRDSLPVIVDGFSQGYVKICPSGLANLIKIIFCQAVEKSDIRAHIYIGEEEFSIYLKNFNEEKELERMTRMASLSGLTAVRIDDSLIKFCVKLAGEFIFLNPNFSSG